MSQMDEVLTHLQKENAELKQQFQFYRERYELSLAASNDGLWDWDPNTNHLFISERWKRTLGLESEILDPHLSIWESRVHPEDLPAVKEALHNHLDGKTEQYSAIYRIRRQDGSYITIQDRGKAIFDNDANPVRMAGCMTDISEQIQQQLAIEKNEQHLRTILNCMSEGILVLDKEGQFLYSNPSFSKVVGLSVEQVEGKTPLDPHWRVIHADGSPYPGSEHPSWITLKTGKPIHNDIQGVYTPDGKLNWILANSEPMLAPSTEKEIHGVVVTFTDITDQIEKEKELSLSAKVFENLRESILICDAQMKIVRANPAFIESTGLHESVILSEAMLFQYEMQGGERCKICNSVKENGHWSGECVRIRNHRQRIDHVSITLTNDTYGDTAFYIVLSSDITQQKESERKIQELAYFDSLTGLPNRLNMLQTLTEKLVHIDKKNQIVIILIDIDRFKTINDSLGHLIGDELLIMAAKRIKTVIRTSDFVCRMGGDEFIAIIDHVNDQQTFETTNRILQSLRIPYHIHGKRIMITASLGISRSPNDGLTVEELLKQADSAMYHAKENGRNRAQFFDNEISKNNLFYLKIENGLHEAVTGGQIYIQYQPQFNYQTRTVIGIEALMRWKHPEEGILKPSVFIPIAEETGLITSLGYFLLDIVCKQIAEWQKHITNLPTIAINLSPKQFLEPSLVKHVQQLIEHYEIKPNALEFEITESAFMQETETTLANINGLANLGCRISIDDFGTGYSNLSYLKRFPIHMIKIDKSFIDDIRHDNDDKAIVDAVIRLAEALNITCLAEGVETKEQLEILKGMGCENIQGFLFSKPLHPRLITELIKQHQSADN
ncbi:EAL and GGDEF domain-containing protein [Neptunomonas concharum]|uniref:cyclic-guanylate-specific phosphodiesterase n=1 Tax=Neptunomonas concharum TaxID=1031538 RepID=A0A5P1RB11_9GAMM|nr:EAL domain-containing protein [Neptunomonas concharum]QEQ96844.1 EAL domain-containing protein [Neptunomonas concharum]